MREGVKSDALLNARYGGQPLQDAKPRLISAGYVTKAALDEELRQAAADKRCAGEADEQTRTRVAREPRAPRRVPRSQLNFRG